jgi:hypothetical protein
VRSALLGCHRHIINGPAYDADVGVDSARWP